MQFVGALFEIKAKGSNTLDASWVQYRDNLLRFGQQYGYAGDKITECLKEAQADYNQGHYGDFKCATTNTTELAVRFDGIPGRPPDTVSLRLRANNKF